MAPNRRPKAKKSALDPSQPKQPRALSRFATDDGGHRNPVFSFALLDRKYEGKWGWKLLKDRDAKTLLDFMAEMARLSWNEVRTRTAGEHRRYHGQPIDSVCPAAQRRLQDLQHDDMSGISRFRLDGTSRLWGFEARDVFYALWWDPHHEVYPVEPR